jgi:hypothetical protein
MTFTPLINYAGYAHVLNAMPCFVHPGNGNLYGIAIEKQGGTRQNLSVYRVRPGNPVRELVKRYVGGVDSQAQIAAGGCVIHPDGSLEVWASAAPKGIPPITYETGFVGGFWPRIAGVDDPYPLAGQVGPPGPPGSGATLFDDPLTSPDWSGRLLSGGVSVDIPAVFGAPIASVYVARLGVSSAAPNVRGRVGSVRAPYLLTVNTQVAGLELHGQGLIPGPVVWVSTVNGAASVWLQILGTG